MSSSSLQDDAGLQSFAQNYGDDPLAARESDLYRGEFVTGFVEKWDELIDWDARAESEGRFFIDVLRAHGKESVLDVATGTGFHSVRLTEAGFDVLSVDGSPAMLAKAFENGRKRGLILKTVQADTAPDVDLEAPAGQVAWAAATVVTAAAHPGVAVPDEAAAWLDRHRGACPPELRPLASRALERVLADRSELVALWNEAGNDDWLTDVQRLVSQLG